MIKNINYKGRLAESDMNKLDFTEIRSTPPPHQKIIDFNGGKLLVFPSGKCRLMGLKKPIRKNVHINDLKIQSVTIVSHLGREVNLINLSNTMPLNERVFEPELFPALRLTMFNPLCVNVFSSGKIVILGLKKLSNQKLEQKIHTYIKSFI